MNRLQKKCFIASAGFHLLLTVILLVGPAFLSSKTHSEDVQFLEFVPVMTTDEKMSGGGSAAAKPPAATQQPIQPPSTPAVPKPPEKVEDPTPQKEVAKDPPPTKDKDESFVPVDKPSRRIPDVSTKLVTNKPDEKAQAKAAAAAEAKERAEANRRLASALASASEHIGNGISEGTSITLKGPGGGGVPYANFLAAVKSAYMRALVTPENLTDENAVTMASVTIARDGTVISARITHLSGDDQLDHAVQRTLDRVRYAAPLPPTSTESQRTVEINFQAKPKNGFG